MAFFTLPPPFFGRVEKLFTLPPGAFAPAPKVHSSVVRITIQPRLESLRVPEAEFIAFLKLCFGQQRKTLWNNPKTHDDEGALPLEKPAALFRALRDGSS